MSWVTWFKISLSRIVLDDTSVPTLRPHPSVGGLYIQKLFAMKSINDTTWIWKGPMPQSSLDELIFEWPRQYEKYMVSSLIDMSK